MCTFLRLFGFAAGAEVVASSVFVVRDTLALGRVLTGIDAFRQVVKFPGVDPSLAVAVVACLVVSCWASVHSLRICTDGSLRFRAASGEVVARAAVRIVRDADAFAGARLLALSVAVGFPARRKDLTIVDVADHVVGGFFGGRCRTAVDALCVRLGRERCFLAAGAEVVAPSVLVEGNTDTAASAR